MTGQFSFRVLVDGFEQEGVLEGGTIERGRDRADETSRAGYCRLDLLRFLPGPLPTLPLGAPVDVFMTPPGGSERQVFGGWLTDRQDAIQRHTPTNTVVTRSLYAVGPLGITPRGRIPEGGYPEQDEHDRVLAAISDVFGRRWNEAAQRWTSYLYPPSNPVTWNTLDPEVGNADISDNGAIVVNQDTDAEDPYAVLQSVQESTGGVLTETKQGWLRYRTQRDRLETYADWQANGTIRDLSKFSPVAVSVQATRSLSEVVNVAEVTYLGGVVRLVDEKAIGDYGRRFTRRLETSLRYVEDARDRAERLLAFGRNPRPTDTQTWPLATLPAPYCDTLLGTDLGDLVQVDDMPIDIDRIGFVERVRLSLSRLTPTLELTVSPVSASVLTPAAWIGVSGRWRDQPGAWEDQTAPDLTTVGGP